MELGIGGGGCDKSGLMDGAGGGTCWFPFPESKVDVGGERLELFEGLNVDDVDEVGLLFFDDFFVDSLPFLVSALFSESGIMANKSASDIDPRTDVLEVEADFDDDIFGGGTDAEDAEDVAEVVVVVLVGFLRGSRRDVVSGAGFSPAEVVDVGAEDVGAPPNKMLAIPVGKPLNPAMVSGFCSVTFGASFFFSVALDAPPLSSVNDFFGGGGLGDSSELNVGSFSSTNLDLLFLLDLSGTNALSGSYTSS